MIGTVTPWYPEKKKIGSTPNVEQPNDRNRPRRPRGEGKRRDNGENTRKKVTPSGGQRECRRQRRSGNPGNQETQANESQK